MNVTPPNRPRRRIAGEAKPGDVVTKQPKVKAPKITGPKITGPKSTGPSAAKSPGADLPKAPSRSDAPKPARTRPIDSRSWLLLALTVAALIFAASGAVAGVRHFRGTDAGTTREAAADAAAVAAETIFSYQWNKLKPHLAESKELMTPKFGKKFEDISPALNALAPQRRIQVKAVARYAAALECGADCADDRVKVLVFIDQARVADGSDKPTVFGNRIEMSMLQRNGKWLVNDIKAL